MELVMYGGFFFCGNFISPYVKLKILMYRREGHVNVNFDITPKRHYPLLSVFLDFIQYAYTIVRVREFAQLVLYAYASCLRWREGRCA